MMAISALSLDRKSGSHSIDALHYYHQAFLTLQNNIWSGKDLLLDGLFLTHFLLLVYEVGFTLSFPIKPARAEKCYVMSTYTPTT